MGVLAAMDSTASLTVASTAPEDGVPPPGAGGVGMGDWPIAIAGKQSAIATMMHNNVQRIRSPFDRFFCIGSRILINAYGLGLGNDEKILHNRADPTLLYLNSIRKWGVRPPLSEMLRAVRCTASSGALECRVGPNNARKAIAALGGPIDGVSLTIVYLHGELISFCPPNGIVYSKRPAA